VFPTSHGSIASFDRRDLRNALATFATGVTIVTARDADGRLHGLTANSFSSVSLDPPLVLWSLACAAPSLPFFRAAKHFGVSILGSEHLELSHRFAHLQPDKFAGVEYTTASTASVDYRSRRTLRVQRRRPLLRRRP